MIVSIWCRFLFVMFRCAAVLCIGGASCFTDGVPNGEILDKFQNRNDRFAKLMLCELV